MSTLRHSFALNGKNKVEKFATSLRNFAPAFRQITVRVQSENHHRNPQHTRRISSRQNYLRNPYSHSKRGREATTPALSQGALNFFHYQLKELQHEEFE
jgi:hypothetical protein